MMYNTWGAETLPELRERVDVIWPLIAGSIASDRDREVAARYLCGETLSQIGKDMGLSVERTRQIFYRTIRLAKNFEKRNKDKADIERILGRPFYVKKSKRDRMAEIFAKQGMPIKPRLTIIYEDNP